MSEDPSFYVENPVRTDDTMAPPGHSALYVLLPVTHQHPNVDWAKEKSRFRDLVLKQIGYGVAQMLLLGLALAWLQRKPDRP